MMGITNIHILSEVDDRQVRVKQAAAQEVLIEAHRKGEHPYPRFECPLCQAKK